MGRIVTFLALCICWIHANGQSIDSLYDVYQNESLTEAQQLDVLLSLAEYRLNTDFELCKSHALAAVERAKKLGDTDKEASAWYLLASTNWWHSYYDETYRYLDSARQLISSESRLYGRILETRGMANFYQAKFQNAIPLLLEAEVVYRKEGDTTKLAEQLYNIALVYDKMGQVEKATEYFTASYRTRILYTTLGEQMYTAGSDPFQSSGMVRKLIEEEQLALATSLEHGDSLQLGEYNHRIGKLYNRVSEYDSSVIYLQAAIGIWQNKGEQANLGLSLLEIGNTYWSMGELIKAEDAFKRSTALFIQEKMHPRVDATLDRLGKLYIQQQKLNKAVSVCTKAKLLSDTIGHPMASVKFACELATLYPLQDQPHVALEYAREAYDISENVNYGVGTTQAHHVLYEVYKNLGQHDEALQHLEAHVDRKNQADLALAARKKREFEIQFDINQREQKIAELSATNQQNKLRIDNQRNFVIVVSIALGIVILLLFVLYRNILKIRILNKEVNSQNRNLQARNEENELLLKEIHHRVKNNLQMISSLLGLQNRRTRDARSKELMEITKNRIKSIGLIHEHLYRSDGKSRISINEYVPALVEVILQSMGGRSKAQVAYQIDKIELNLDNVIPMALIINELVINSLKYGIALSDPQIVIKITSSDNALIISVKDNGPGTTTFRPGFGFTIIQSYVSNANGALEINHKAGFMTTATLPLS